MIKQNAELSNDPKTEHSKMKDIALQEGIVSQFTSMICIAESDELPASIAQNVVKRGESYSYDYQDLYLNQYDPSIDDSYDGFDAYRSRGSTGLDLSEELCSSSRNFHRSAPKKFAGFSFSLPSLPKLSFFSKMKSKDSVAPAMCESDLMFEGSAAPQIEMMFEDVDTASREYMEESEDGVNLNLVQDVKEFREDNLVTLLNLASTKGYYSDVSKVEKLLHIDVEGFLLNHNVNADSTEVWLTCLVVVFLDVRCQHMKPSWELVANKSKKWLQRSNVSNLEHIEESCKKHIEKVFKN